MIYKMGMDRYKELKGNLTEQIIFRNNDENHMLKTDKDVERLETHTYLSGELKEIKATNPIFFTEDESLSAEYEYQKNLPVVAELLIMNKVSKPAIAVFDDIVFERDDSVYLQNIETKDMQKVIFRSDKEYKNAREELAKIYKYVFGEDGEKESDTMGFMSRWRRITREAK